MMILNGMDYLTIPLRFDQTGEIIWEGNLWLELDDSLPEFRASTVWGGERAGENTSKPRINGVSNNRYLKLCEIRSPQTDTFIMPDFGP